MPYPSVCRGLNMRSRRASHTLARIQHTWTFMYRTAPHRPLFIQNYAVCAGLVTECTRPGILLSSHAILGPSLPFTATGHCHSASQLQVTTPDRYMYDWHVNLKHPLPLGRQSSQAFRQTRHKSRKIQTDIVFLIDLPGRPAYERWQMLQSANGNG